jgi:NAD(P)-dependent dehydrogenase (short-subunit alcohol dehydrogenase family)
MPKTNILIIGATRGLGASLANAYAAQEDTIVYGTTRAASPPKTGFHEGIKWVRGLDLNKPDAGETLVKELGGLGVEGGLGVVVSCVSLSVSLGLGFGF